MLRVAGNNSDIRFSFSSPHCFFKMVVPEPVFDEKNQKQEDLPTTSEITRKYLSIII